MMTADLHYLTISELAPMIERKEISPVEVTRHMLDRIERVDGDLRAYATMMGESAIERARQAESEIVAGNYRGPLHGVPIAVKDLCNTEGITTRGGSAVFMDNVPDHVPQQPTDEPEFIDAQESTDVSFEYIAGVDFL